MPQSLLFPLPPQALMALGICQNAGKAPIIACQVTPERNFAFIEFRCRPGMERVPARLGRKECLHTARRTSWQPLMAQGLQAHLLRPAAPGTPLVVSPTPSCLPRCPSPQRHSRCDGGAAAGRHPLPRQHAEDQAAQGLRGRLWREYRQRLPLRGSDLLLMAGLLWTLPCLACLHACASFVALQCML